MGAVWRQPPAAPSRSVVSEQASPGKAWKTKHSWPKNRRWKYHARMPSLTPHAGKDSQRADLRLPGITRFTPPPVRATGEDMGNRLGSQRWGDPEATLTIFGQILQNFARFSEIRKNFAKFCRIFCRILQKCVDFEKCWKMLYWMQKFMKILLKFGEILTKFWQNFDKILLKFRSDAH